MLRDALLILAGPAWDVSVDDGARQVCFERRTAPATPAASSAASAAQASGEQVRP
jgi:type IV pili sensor histidine kinase/response regulator